MTEQQGDIAELASTMEVMNLLECPVCNEVPLPPIYLCQNGHTICHVCLKQMNKCGLCQQPFTNARNYFMESVILTSTHRCRFQNFGCKELIRGDALENHIKVCIFRDYSSKKKSKDETLDLDAVVTVGCCQWIPSNKDVPIYKNAVEGGIENGDRLYIARCHHGSSIIPGKLNSKSRLISFPWSGKEFIKAEYEVLISVPETLTWVGSNNGQLPDHAVIAGRTDIGEALYLGRCGHQGTLAVGNVLPSTKSCQVSSQGLEHSYKMYEVLVKNAKGVELDIA